MKPTLALVAVASAVFAPLGMFAADPAGASPACLNPPSHLRAWWPGDGSAGNLLGDPVGSLMNGATASATGEVGTGFNLDGVDDRVEIPDSPDVSVTGAITVDAWIKPNASATG